MAVLKLCNRVNAAVGDECNALKQYTIQSPTGCSLSLRVGPLSLRVGPMFH